MDATFLRLLRLARPISGWMLLAVVLGVATIGGGVGLMATSAYLISEAALHPSIAALEVAIVGVRFFGLCRGLLRYLERLITHQVTFRLLAQLRTWLYSALEPLAPARLSHYMHHNAGGYSSGDVLSSIVSDVETLQNFYARVLAPPLVAALVGVGMWFFFGAFEVRLALTFLGCFLVSAVGIPLLVHLLSRKSGQRLITARAALHEQLVDHLQGLGDIVAFGQEEYELKRLRAVNAVYNNTQLYAATIGGLQEALGTFCTNASALLILLLGILQVRAGHLNGVFLALLVLAALASFEAILPLAPAFQQMSASLAAARRLFALVDTRPLVVDPEQPVPLPGEPPYDICFEHLRFRYENEAAWILRDVHFTMKEGECVALVGASGAGKSTIANLLQRFWEYSDGHILLAGQELRKYRQDDVRQLISVVSQDTHLFNTTIRQNLLLARQDASEEELTAAARQACIHDVILALPHGYDTEIGEQGLCLSGGQRQRLALARAILKKAPILLLDEPTAHLDALTAHEIRQTLRTLIPQHTTLLITHNQADVELADVVVVLEEGCAGSYLKR